MGDWYTGANRAERWQTAIRELGLDALAAVTPENAHYLSGFGNYIATHWRLPGLFTCAVGATGAKAVVTGDFGADPRLTPPWTHITFRSWTESVDVRDVPGASIAERIEQARPAPVARPAQFWLDEIAERVVAAIQTVAPAPRRVGIDLAEADAGFVTRLQAGLPGTALVDATALFETLRAIKDADEIAHLRRACALTEIGIAGAIARLRPGMSEAAVNAAYHVAVHEAVLADAQFAGFRQAEGMATIGIGAENSRVVAPGATIKFDMQVDIAGYHSDIGRTVVWRPTPEQRAIHGALREALATVASALRPGRTFAEIFEIGRRSMEDAGFSAYSRGHLGHSDGLTQHFEEGPFLAPGEHRRLAEGMVLSIELPYYVYGVGAFQMERMALITADGAEMFDELPLELDLELGAE